jgi:hypothetical protein
LLQRRINVLLIKIFIFFFILIIEKHQTKNILEQIVLKITISEFFLTEDKLLRYFSALMN